MERFTLKNYMRLAWRAPVDLDKEVEHVAEYIRQTWTPISGLDKLVQDIRDQVGHMSRGVFKSRELNEYITEMGDTRKEQLAAALCLSADAPVEFHDAICLQLFDLFQYSDELLEIGMTLDGPWDVTARITELETECAQRYPGLADARPLPEKVRRRKLRRFELDDRPQFKGTERHFVVTEYFADRLSAISLCWRVASGQGTYSHGLVEAIFNHFLDIARHQNTEAIKQGLDDSFPEVERPVVIFELDFKPKNPILKAMLELAAIFPRSTEEQFQVAMAKHAAFKALSEEEQIERKAARKAEVAKMLAEPRDPPSLADQQAAADRLARCVAVMRAGFEEAALAGGAPTAGR